MAWQRKMWLGKIREVAWRKPELAAENLTRNSLRERVMAWRKGEMAWRKGKVAFRKREMLVENAKWLGENY